MRLRELMRTNLSRARRDTPFGELVAAHRRRDSRLVYVEDEAGRLVGCGYLIRVRPDRDWRDLGMWVPSALRRRGYARRILADLKDWCLREGWRPCCGCAADNVASRRALEANGFVSRHAVLSFAL